MADFPATQTHADRTLGPSRQSGCRRSPSDAQGHFGVCRVCFEAAGVETLNTLLHFLSHVFLSAAIVSSSTLSRPLPFNNFTRQHVLGLETQR